MQIHTAEHDLKSLERSRKVEYRSGVMVERLVERNDRVELFCEGPDARPEKIELKRVFLAAGAINSTRIVLESKSHFDQPVIMKTTQGFLVPMINMRSAKFSWPDSNTLTGAFLEFKVPGLSAHWVHTQINAANELVLARLGYQSAQSTWWKNKVLKLGLSRLLVAICNFHSDHAGRHELMLRPPQGPCKSTLQISSRASEKHQLVVQQGARHLLRLMVRIGVFPIFPLKRGKPKHPVGWHFGGSLPMSREPKKETDTDLLGRPQGWNRIHVVDSSIFPSLPGTTVALLAMANARRIASQAELD